MKERCHICGRKMKSGLTQCKICKAEPEEMVVADRRAKHHVNLLATPLVNLILTDRRLLVFEDMGNVGGGGLIGLAANKVVQGTLGHNGSLKQDIPFSSIVGVESEDKGSKGIQLTVSLSSGKALKFTTGTSYSDPSLSAEEFVNRVRASIAA